MQKKGSIRLPNIGPQKSTTANQDPQALDEIMDTDVRLKIEERNSKEDYPINYPSPDKQYPKYTINTQVQNDVNFDLDYRLYQEEQKVDVFKKKEEMSFIQPRKSLKQPKGNNNQMKRVMKKYTLGDICCRTKTGYNCCGKTSHDSVFNNFGVGVTLYFKFIKNLTCYFFLFFLLGVPQLYISYKISLDGPERYKNDLNQFLYDTSIGPIGTATNQCSVSENLFDNSVYTTTESLTSLECSKGQLDVQDTLIISFFNDSSASLTCSNLYDENYQNQFTSLNEKTCGSGTYISKLESIITQNACDQASSCSVSNTDFYDAFQDCWSDIQSELNLQYRISVQCTSADFDMITIFGKTYTASIQEIAPFIAILDGIIILLFIQMLISLNIADQKTINNVFSDRVQISKFTIMITNLPSMLECDLKTQIKPYLMERINVYLQKKKKNNNAQPKNVQIVDVRIAETFTEIQLTRQQGQIDKQKQDMMAQFIQQFDPQLKQIKHDDYKFKLAYLQEFVNNMKNQKQKKRAQKSYNKILKQKTKTAKLENMIEKNDNEAYPIKFAYVTFNTMQGCQVALQALQVNNCTNFWNSICCCCKVGPKFQRKTLKYTDGEVPDNILWENIYIKDTVKLIRRIISILFTVAFLVGSFIAISYVKIKTNEIKDLYPEINCNEEKFRSITDAQVVDENMDESGAGYIQCYCYPLYYDIAKYQFNETGYFVDHQDTYPICQDWLQDYIWIQALPFLASASIIFVNFFIQIIFRKLSAFEKYNYLTEELSARIQKIFIAMFINTGLLLLVINIDMNINKTFFSSIFDGTYKDFDPYWFKNVGTVILYTIAINTVSTPLVLLGFQILRVTSRCRDRGCSCNGKKTKKKTTKELIALYTGPEFMIDLRYSQILNVVYICFIYSSGLPLMYLCIFIHLFLLYWFDKIWVLKICKKPLNYDEQMQKITKRILWLVPILHLLVAIYIYGNFQIFYDQDKFETDYFQFNADDYFQNFFQRAYSRKYNIYLFTLLVIFVCILLLRIFIWAPIRAIAKKTCKKAYNKTHTKNPYVKDSVYSFMRPNEIEQDINLCDYYIEKNKSQQPFSEQMNIRKSQLIQQQQENNTNRNKNHSINLMGQFSYDIRHNPIYKELFNWESQAQNLLSTARHLSSVERTPQVKTFTPQK